MASRSRIVVLIAVVLIVGIAVALINLRGLMRCAGFPGPGITADELPPPAPPGTLRIVNWNVRNFPLDQRPQYDDLGFSRRTNICDLEDALGGLHADLIGFSEVGDKRRFPPILRRATGDRKFGIRFSSHGGQYGQMVALAWDMDRLKLEGEPFELEGVDLDPSLRPALAGRFRSVDVPDLSFVVVQVHLAAAPRGYDSRRKQYNVIVDRLREFVADVGENNIVVMGDFNTTGRQGGTVSQEVELLDRVFSEAGLRRLENATGCTEYWEGRGDNDGVQVPALLDRVYVAGLHRWMPTSPQSWLHCRRHACETFVSIKGREDGTFWDVSDHCPVTFELKL